jgi:hypothetical protein
VQLRMLSATNLSRWKEDMYTSRQCRFSSHRMARYFDSLRVDRSRLRVACKVESYFGFKLTFWPRNSFRSFFGASHNGAVQRRCSGCGVECSRLYGKFTPSYMAWYFGYVFGLTSSRTDVFWPYAGKAKQLPYNRGPLFKMLASIQDK